MSDEWGEVGEVPREAGVYEVKTPRGQTLLRRLSTDGCWYKDDDLVATPDLSHDTYRSCQFRRIDTPQQPWLDQPDGEGWWWQWIGGEIRLAKVMQADNGWVVYTAEGCEFSHASCPCGKWQLATPPEPPKPDYRGKVGVFMADEGMYRIVKPDGEVYRIDGSPSEPIGTFSKIQWLHGPYDVKGSH